MVTVVCVNGRMTECSVERFGVLWTSKALYKCIYHLPVEVQSLAAGLGSDNT